MANFHLEILTPAKKIYSAEVLKVIVPAYDGEVGVRPGHNDFVGVLGTGVLGAITAEHHTHVCMVCSGIYQIKGGKLTLFADIAVDAGEIDPELERDSLGHIRIKMKEGEHSPEELEELRLQEARIHSRLAAIEYQCS